MKIQKLINVFLPLSFLALPGCFGHNVGPASEVKINQTPERLIRGKYLVMNVSDCLGCHSKSNANNFGLPMISGTEGQGGMLFGEDEGLPGNIYAKNITPDAIGNWTDGEVLRAVTEGVSKDGTALFPLIPYTHLGIMSQDDVYSIIAYIRTLKPIKNEVPARTLNFPLNFIVKSMPKKAEFQPIPDKTTTAYGGYLVNAAGCIECHTQMDKGTPKPGMDFAGGSPFKLKGFGTVRSANITPDKNTGIGTWTREQFIARFKQYDTPEAKQIPVKPKEFNTVMPWLALSGMTEEDLGAIYDYLKTLKPVENKVVKFESES